MSVRAKPSSAIRLQWTNIYVCVPARCDLNESEMELLVGWFSPGLPVAVNHCRKCALHLTRVITRV